MHWKVLFDILLHGSVNWITHQYVGADLNLPISCPCSTEETFCNNSEMLASELLENLDVVYDHEQIAIEFAIKIPSF